MNKRYRVISYQMMSNDMSSRMSADIRRHIKLRAAEPRTSFDFSRCVMASTIWPQKRPCWHCRCVKPFVACVSLDIKPYIFWPPPTHAAHARAAKRKIIIFTRQWATLKTLIRPTCVWPDLFVRATGLDDSCVGSLACYCKPIAPKKLGARKRAGRQRCILILEILISILEISILILEISILILEISIPFAPRALASPARAAKRKKIIFTRQGATLKTLIRPTCVWPDLFVRATGLDV